jgi:hypothetical protein
MRIVSDFIRTTTQLHVRQILTPASNFKALAQENEAFVSDDNMVLSLQAHPEIMKVFATFVMRHGNTYSGRYLSENQVEEKIQKLGGEQDGLTVLERVLVRKLTSLYIPAALKVFSFEFTRSNLIFHFKP